MAQETRQWILANPPTSAIVFEGEDATFKLQTKTLSAPGPGQVLLKFKHISNDPAQRPWIQSGQDASRGYVPPVLKGEVMRAFGVCEVVQSNSDDLKPGQLVIATPGWSEYAVLDAKACLPIQPNESAGIRPTHFIGALGGPGTTAYYGLVDIVNTTADDAVVISGAAGATGSMAIQIAKHLIGCKKVIGIAGGEKKCKWVEELGADICIDYKSQNWKDELRKATEGFVEVYYDNVGGEILDFMLTRVKKFGRIAACGSVATYNNLREEGVKNWVEIILNRLQVKGFIILDADRAPITQKLVQGVKDGKIKLDERGETIVPTAFEDVPKTWHMLFEGGNQGKLVTELKW